MRPNERYNRRMRKRYARLATADTERRCFAEIDALGDDLVESRRLYSVPGPVRLLKGWKSRHYVAQLYLDQDVLRLTVQRARANQWIRRKNHDRRPLTRAELEAVKTACGFDGEPAIELYPPVDLVCDVADMRHLWFDRPPLSGTRVAMDFDHPPSWDEVMARKREDPALASLAMVTAFDAFHAHSTMENVEVLLEVNHADVPYMWRPKEGDDDDCDENE